MGLIWFDAHGDMNTPQSSPSGNIHGMPLAILLGYGDRELASIGCLGPKVKAHNVALVGIRDIDGAERALIRDSGIHTFTMRDIDEQGMARTSDEKFRIAKRLYELTTRKFGISPEDLFFDTLTFAIASGEEYRNSAKETLEAIRLVKQHLPGAKTILGLSNISFGLAPQWISGPKTTLSPSSVPFPSSSTPEGALAFQMSIPSMSVASCRRKKKSPS